MLFLDPPIQCSSLEAISLASHFTWITKRLLIRIHKTCTYSNTNFRTPRSCPLWSLVAPPSGGSWLLVSSFQLLPEPHSSSSAAQNVGLQRQYSRCQIIQICTFSWHASSKYQITSNLGRKVQIWIILNYQSKLKKRSTGNSAIRRVKS